MEFLKNQSLKQSVKYVKYDDKDKKLSLNISLSCNHELDKELLLKIERTINDLFLSNYIKVEEFNKQEKEKLLSEAEQMIVKKKAESEYNKEIKEQLKLNNSMKNKLKLKNIF